MPRIPATLRPLLSRAIPVLLLISAGVLAYSRTVSNRRSYVIQRNFRLLDTIRQQMAARITNLQTVVQQGDSDYIGKNGAPGLKCQDDGAVKTPSADSTGTAILEVSLVGKKGRYHCHGDLPAIVEPYTNSEAFDGYIFASGNGDVLYQKMNAGVRIVNLRHAVEDGLREANAADGRGEQAHAEDFDIAARTSRLVPVRLAATRYELFLLPFQFAHDSGKNWLLAALVRADHPRFERFESVPVAVPLAFLVLILVASFPLHKLWVMRPAERLRSRDRLWFALCSALTFSLLVVYLADLSMLADPGGDPWLKELADGVSTNFQAEIRNAYQELELFEKPPCFDGSAKSNGNPYTRCRTPDVSGRPYPYFESVFWMDDKGQQKIRWRTDKIRPPLGDRGGRPYFKDVVQKKFWQVCLSPQSGRKACPEEMWPFTLEPLMSWTTGEYLAVLGAPSEHTLAGKTKLVAAAMTLRLPAAIRPVVRPGFGFAIVDDDGAVQFLSDWASNPDRNVFTECAKGEQLRALVRYHQTGYLTTDFHSRPHRLYVRPLGDENLILPWSLIAFQDRTGPLAMNLRVLLRCGGFFIVYFGAVCLFVIVVWKFRGDRLSWLIWRAEPRDYVYLILLYTLCGALVWRAIPRWGEFQAIAAALICIYALAVSPFRLRNGRPVRLVLGGALCWADLGIPIGVAVISWLAGDQPKQALVSTIVLLLAGIIFSLPVVKDRLRIKALPGRDAQSAAAAALVIAMGILPALGFYRAAFEREAEGHVREAQAFLARALNQRTLRIESLFRTLTFEEPEALLDRRLNLKSGRDVYPLLPGFLFDGDVPSHGNGKECRIEGDWRVCREHGKLFLEDLNSRGRVRMAADAPVFPLSRRPWFWMWSSVLVAALALWISFLVRRIAVIDLGKAPDYPTLEIPPQVGENLLVMTQPFAESARRLEGIEGVYAINLAQLESAGTWLNVISDTVRYSRIVAVEHFEFNMDDSGWTAAKLELLEHLVYVLGKTIVLFSTVDPEFYLTHGGSGQGQPVTAGSLERWSALLDHFSRRELRERGDPRFEQTVREFASRLAPGIDPEEARRVLCDECGGHPRLQEICREMCAQLPPKSTVSSKELLDAIEMRVRAYYKALWDACSKREKLVLVQVAQDGLLNPKSVEVARELRRKRLIETAPLRVMNETFRRFVSHELTAEQIYAWEREGERRAWGRMGIVAAGVVAMAIMVLVVGQDNDLVKLVTVIVTFATSLLGIGGKLFAKVQSTRGDGGSAQA